MSARYVIVFPNSCTKDDCSFVLLTNPRSLTRPVPLHPLHRQKKRIVPAFLTKPSPVEALHPWCPLWSPCFTVPSYLTCPSFSSHFRGRTERDWRQPGWERDPLGPDMSMSQRRKSAKKGPTGKSSSQKRKLGKGEWTPKPVAGALRVRTVPLRSEFDAWVAEERSHVQQPLI